ncbi:unnamed protein product [Peronospora farinosa]|uniref:Transmembrane protein n=1 Tax=Peronospora farinosa TaxID=134698 RepID=A0AAV0SUM6_9STRA|nr:unnamed protein product [Peronospora farinosa]CAI5706516.1 unnamed protein product [Peronospora farinosa]
MAKSRQETMRLWMTGAGLLMVAMSVISAVQELQFPNKVSSYQNFLNQEMTKCGRDMVTLPHLSLGTGNDVEQVTKDDTSSMTLNIASASSPSAIHCPSTFSEKISRRGSEDSIGALESACNTTIVETSALWNNATEVSNKLDVLHCGTVIDIQGSLGFIIPHDLRVEASASGSATRSSAMTAFDRHEKQQKMPLVIPFNLNEEQTAARQAIAVGKTVEFAYSHAASSSDSPATMCALNVTPVPTDNSIAKSRSALQSCKQAREVSFARAMEELTMISPRNVPVKHHVDLIKYAEKLDDHDSPFD